MWRIQKNRIYQEHRAKKIQEIEELRRNCCEEADRVRQLRIDDSSMQQKEKPSTVISGTRWILWMKRKNSVILRPRGALECPTFPVNPREFRVPEEWRAAILACRAIHGTPWVRQETFFEDRLAQEGPSWVFVRTQGILQDLLVDWDQVTQKIPWDLVKEWDESRRAQWHQLLDLQSVQDFSLQNPYIVLEELILKIVWWKLRGILSRTCMSENSQTQVTFNVGVNFRTEVCANTPCAKLTMPCIKEVEIAKSIHDLSTTQSIERKHFPDCEMLDAKIASALRKIMSNTLSKGEPVLKSSELKNMTDFWEDDKLLTWSMFTFKQLERMMQLRAY